MRERERTVAMRGGKGGVDSKAKIDVCLGYPVLGLKNSKAKIDVCLGYPVLGLKDRSLICLPSCSN